MFVSVSRCAHDLQSLLWPAGGDDTGSQAGEEQKARRTPLLSSLAVGTTNLLTRQHDYRLINSVARVADFPLSLQVKRSWNPNYRTHLQQETRLQHQIMSTRHLLAARKPASKCSSGWNPPLGVRSNRRRPFKIICRSCDLNWTRLRPGRLLGSRSAMGKWPFPECTNMRHVNSGSARRVRGARRTFCLFFLQDVGAPRRFFSAPASSSRRTWVRGGGGSVLVRIHRLLSKPFRAYLDLDKKFQGHLVKSSCTASRIWLNFNQIWYF